MKFIIIFTILYFVIVILELYLVNRHIKNVHKKDRIFNKKLNINNDKENQFICNELKNRIEKLKTMSYKDWLEYNQKNLLVNYEKEKLYVFVYELSKNNDDTTFFVRVHILDDYLNMERKTFESYVKEKSSYFTQHDSSDQVSKNIYNTNEWANGCSINSYLWVDPLENYRPIIKRAVSKKFIKEENGQIIKGYISIGYTSSVLLNSLQYYFEFLENYFLVLIFLFTYLIIVVNLYINQKEKIKTMILFILLNVFTIFSLLSKDIITNVKYEETKIDNLNTSVLGISFLVGVNIFIIDTLKKKYVYKALFNETSFLFCASIVALMLSIFKVTTYFNTNDIKKHRIENQIFFNISIIINIFILFNYFTSIYNKK